MQHSAVWTGDRMAIAFGRNETGPLEDVFMYQPELDHWHSVNVQGNMAARYDAPVFWIGRGLLVWGGLGVSGPLNSGGILEIADPSITPYWSHLPLNGAPSPRHDPVVVLTPSHLIVWGGFDGASYLNDGAMLDLTALQWSPIPTANAPEARSEHAGVWTGQEMIVLGGRNGSGTLSDAWAFDPVKQTWRSLPGEQAVTGRYGAGIHYIDPYCLVFGGETNDGFSGVFGRLNPLPPWNFYRKP